MIGNPIEFSIRGLVFRLGPCRFTTSNKRTPGIKCQKSVCVLTLKFLIKKGLFKLSLNNEKFSKSGALRKLPSTLLKAKKKVLKASAISFAQGFNLSMSELKSIMYRLF